MYASDLSGLQHPVLGSRGNPDSSQLKRWPGLFKRSFFVSVSCS